MKREKRLTKREQKALKRPSPPSAATLPDEEHIHCVACGRHIAPAELMGAKPTATRLLCQHGGAFASCVACTRRTRELLATHDRTGQPVMQAEAWH